MYLIINYQLKTVSVRIKIVTVIYVFVLAGIVVLADLRGTRYLLNFVGNISLGAKIGHFVLLRSFSQNLKKISFFQRAVWKAFRRVPF